MSEPVIKQKRGRLRKDADTSQIGPLAAIGLKNKEIAVLTGVPEIALERRYSKLLAVKRAEAAKVILEKQMQMVAAGDRTAVIWGSKNLAGWTDRQDVTSGGESLKVIVERIG